MNEQPKHPKFVPGGNAMPMRPATAGSWKPGLSPNPKGRPTGSRQRLAEDFIESLRQKWATHGDAIVDQVTTEDPGKILDVMSRLIPREVAASLEVRQALPGNLSPSEWDAMCRVIGIVQQLGVGGDLEAIYGAIEEDLRARLARPVESASLAIEHAPVLAKPPY